MAPPTNSPPLPPSIIKSGSASKVPVALLPWPDARLLQDAPQCVSVITCPAVYMAAVTFTTALVLLPVVIFMASPSVLGRFIFQRLCSCYILSFCLSDE